MAPWVPILAQALSLAVGDRTEVRLRVEGAERTPEAETRPYGELRLIDRRSALSLMYMPVFVLSPLDSRERDLYIFHAARLGFTFQQRRTTYSIAQTAGYGRQNFGSTALSAVPGLPGLSFPGMSGLGVATPVPNAGTTPTPADGTTVGTPGAALPGTGTPGAGTVATGTNTGATLLRETLTLALLRTDLIINHMLTRNSSLSFGAGYVVIGGFGSSRGALPLQSGPDARIRYDLRLTGRDALFTNLSGTYGLVSNGDRLFRAALEQGYAHQFTETIQARISVGISYVRQRSQGVTTERLYPTLGSNALAGLSYTTRLGGGMFTASLGVGYSPVFDRLTALIDPRFMAFGGLTWIKHRTTLFLNTGATISLRPSQQGAISNYTGSTGLYYRIADGWLFESGLRGLRQIVTGAPDTQFSYALYAALRYDTTLF